MRQLNLRHSKLLIFLKKVRTIIDTNLANEHFSIAQLCEQLGYSRMQLHRNIKAATGLSTAFYIRKIRMEKACELLASDARISVQEVVFAVGYKDPSYFTKVFLMCFGQTPRRWQKRALN